MKLQIGNVVRLKRGRRQMTVVANEKAGESSGVVTTKWFDSKNRLRSVPVAELHRAYSRGRYAKMNGWERLTPYTCEPKNHYWLRGYDGLPMEQNQ